MNGWRNYETWAANLWIQEDADFWDDVASGIYEESVDDNTFTRKENAAIDLADRLDEFYDTNVPELRGIYSDLLNAALSEVDWYEIASSMMDDIVGCES